jgi:hypothetical protein
MNKITFLREKTLFDLRSQVSANLHIYREGSFEDLQSEPSLIFEGKTEIDYSVFEKVLCGRDDHQEVECCVQMHRALGHLSPYLARDLRLWVHLTHTHLLSYARQRWPIPPDDAAAVKHIKTHFFGHASRGIERDNAASRLWWMAFLCSRVDGLTLEEALTAFLHSSDARANIMERPTTAQCETVFSCVVRKLHASLKTDARLFQREVFREVMKGLNVHGGVQLVDLLSPADIDAVIDKYNA